MCDTKMLPLKRFLTNTKINSNICSVLWKKKHVWTSENVVKSPFKDISIPETTVIEYVWRNLDKWPTKTAVVCGVTNRSYTYEQIYKQSQVFAANLRKKFKINDGDSVAVMMPNMPEFITAVFGILGAGGVVTTFNPVYTAHEVQRQLIMSDAKVIVVHPDIVPTIKEALKLCKRNLPIVAVNIDQGLPEGTISYKELVEDVHVDLSVLKGVKRTAKDVAFLPYSSGTTGLPKGVELTNRNIIANCEQQNTECRLYHYTTETNQDVCLLLLPMFHCYGLCIVMLHKFSVGLKLVTLPKLQPEIFLNSLIKYKINLLYLAPPLVLLLGSHPQVTAKHFDSIRCITSGAAPLPEADIRKLLQKAQSKMDFVQGYGLTETSPLATIGPLGFKNYNSVGLALPNVELRVVNEELNNLGPNEVGELLIKGPNVMKGYKDNPEANSQVLIEDGWFRSGDLAKIDENGAVTIVDRLKELIKVKGFQVPPAELEAVIKEHPSVFDTAVVGIPDANTGERPKAFVVLKEGTNLDKNDLIDFISERVAPYKKVNHVEYLESIPKNPSGKILRRVLKEKYCY